MDSDHELPDAVTTTVDHESERVVLFLLRQLPPAEMEEIRARLLPVMDAWLGE